MRIKPKLASQLRPGDNLGDALGEVISVLITYGDDKPVGVNYGHMVVEEEWVENVGMVRWPTYPVNHWMYFNYDDLITLHVKRGI